MAILGTWFKILFRPNGLNPTPSPGISYRMRVNTSTVHRARTSTSTTHRVRLEAVR